MVKTTTFAKWGNSIGIRVPDIFIETMRVSAGDAARVSYVNGEIRISPQRKKLSMRERIANITPTNLNIDRAWLNSKPVGNEVWSYEK
jgi:antitoxin MazE